MRNVIVDLETGDWGNAEAYRLLDFDSLSERDKERMMQLNDAPINVAAEHGTVIA